MRKESGNYFVALAITLIVLSLRAAPAALLELSSADVNIRDESGAFHPVEQQLSGDGEVIMRLQSFQTVDRWSRVGLMLRESLQAGARHVLLVFSPTNGVALHYRLAPGDARGSDR